MDDRNFEAYVNKALRSPRLWADLVASNDAVIRAERVLIQILERVNSDEDRWKQRWVAAQEANRVGDLPDRALGALRRDRAAWRERATPFRRRVQDGLRELQDRRRPAPDVRERLGMYRRLFEDLVLAIHDHESGAITDPQLHGLLDRHVVQTKHGERTLRKALADGLVLRPEQVG